MTGPFFEEIFYIPYIYVLHTYGLQNAVGRMVSLSLPLIKACCEAHYTSTNTPANWVIGHKTSAKHTCFHVRLKDAIINSSLIFKF